MEIPAGAGYSDLIWAWSAPGGIALLAGDHFTGLGGIPVLPLRVDWQLYGGVYVGPGEEHLIADHRTHNLVLTPGLVGAAPCMWDMTPVAQGSTFLAALGPIEGMLWQVRRAGFNSWLLRARNSSLATLAITVSLRRLTEPTGEDSLDTGSMIQ